MSIRASSQAAHLSGVFARALGGDRTDDRVVGLEHEYVVTRDGRSVDFTRLIHDLPLDGRRIDPSDVNAYRCRWGGAVTADGREAEIAIPPVPLSPGFSRNVADLSITGYNVLRDAVAGAGLEGYSTHLSVSLPTHVADGIARTYALRFAPALMMLLDRPSSPGLLVRPRPGRLELGGEYVEGRQRRAAVTFAAASAIACARARRSMATRRSLPPRLEVGLQPARERYGLFVDANGFGCDLYGMNRAAVLRRQRGGSIRAQHHLEAAWAAARSVIEPIAAPDEVSLVDDVVAARTSLPLEQTEPEEQATLALPMEGTPFASALDVRARPGCDITAVAMGWHAVWFEIGNGDRTAVVTVPRRELATFLAALDAGRLDGVLNAYLRLPACGRVFAASDHPGIGDSLPPAGALLLPERNVQGRRLAPPGSGGPGGAGRHGKDRDEPRQQRSRRGPRRIPRAAVGAAAVVAVASVAAVVVATRGGDEGTVRDAPAPSIDETVGDTDPAALPVATHRPTTVSETVAASTVAATTTTAAPTTTLAPTTTAVVRTGAASGTAAGLQDGTYAIEVTTQIVTPTVQAGAAMSVQQVAIVTGPNWARFPDSGTWTLECQPVDDNPRQDTASLDVILVPVATAGDSAALVDLRTQLVSGVPASQVFAPYPGAFIASGASDASYTVTSDGCEATDTYIDSAAIPIPTDVAAGEYVIVPGNVPYRNWPECDIGCRPSYSSFTGALPTVVITAA